jgi:hypothetical protein
VGDSGRLRQPSGGSPKNPGDGAQPAIVGELADVDAAQATEAVVGELRVHNCDHVAESGAAPGVE